MAEEVTKEESTDSKLSVNEILQEIREYETAFSDWLKEADDNVKAYRDETDAELKSRGINSGKSYNIFWSNVQIQRPAYYSRAPKVECERRWKDRDPVGRFGAEVLERVGQYQVSSQDFDSIIRSAVDDLLIPARGEAWVRKEVVNSTEILEVDPETQQPLFAVAEEKTKLEFVDYRDFGHNVTRRWEDVVRVWRKLHLRKKQVAKEFGTTIADELKYEGVSEVKRGKKSDDVSPDSRCAFIYEVWCKETRTIYHLTKDRKEFLKTSPDVYKLDGFFPCPKPIYADHTSDSLIPISDYSRYRRLALHLDDLVVRKNELLDAIKVIGCYDASQKEIADIFNSGACIHLVASTNWAQFQQANGLRGSIDFIDIEPYVKALIQIDQDIASTENLIYQLTGISDILRGYSDPNATATAEGIKSNFATLRLEFRQKEIARFARDLIAIMTELSIEHFDPQTIYEMASVDQMSPEMQQLFPQALQLLKDDKQRRYRISIETDSTVAVDEQQEKQQRTEAVEAYSTLLEKNIPMMMQAPELQPIISELLLFGVRAFPTGRPLEYALEQTLEQLAAKLQQQRQAGPPPDPAMQKVQMEGQARQAEMQMKQQDQQANFQLKQMEMKLKQEAAQLEAQIKQLEYQLKEQEAAAKLKLEEQKFQFESRLKQAQLENDKTLGEMKISNSSRASGGGYSSASAGATVPSDDGSSLSTEISMPGSRVPVVIQMPPQKSKRKTARMTTDPVTGERMAIVEEID